MTHTGSTAEFAKANLVKPQTVIVALSRHGHLYGRQAGEVSEWPIGLAYRSGDSKTGGGVMNNAYHPHPSVNLALNYLHILGCPITDEVLLAAKMLWGETQEHEPTVADTSIILAAELLQRAELVLCSGKPQNVCLAVPMLEVMHSTVHAVADDLGHELPCCCTETENE